MHSIVCRKRNMDFVYSPREQFLKPEKGPLKNESALNITLITICKAKRQTKPKKKSVKLDN